MKTIDKYTLLLQTIEPKLVADDDPALWSAALVVLADELEQRHAEDSGCGVFPLLGR